MRTIIVIVLICVGNVVLGHEDHEESCTSPIDLNSKESTCGEGDGRPVVTLGDSFDGVLTNNKWGSSILVSIPKEAAKKVTVKIGDKDYNYLPDYHFHWGTDSTTPYGSEHTEDGKRHQMEMHITTNQTNGETIGDVLCAQTFFIDETDGPDNAAFSSLTDVLSKLKNAGVETHTVKSNLVDMVGEAIKGDFYQYWGTPFVPPCSVVAIWTIYKTPLKISKAQMAAFREARVAGAFNPTQPLNGNPEKKRELHESSKKC